MRRLIAGILIFSFLFPLGTSAQTQTRDWDQLSRLKASDEVLVDPVVGKRAKGAFQSFSENQIVLSGGTSIERDNIRRIYLVGGHSYGKPLAVGILVSGGTGAAVGAATGGCKPNNWCFVSRGEGAAILMVLGVAAGAVGGAIWSLTHRKRTLIYERH